MQEFGTLPLPPYIEYREEKEADYQTIFAVKDGSVASPTASLHFTDELLAKLPHERHMVTLHVGLGTFQPINTDDIRHYAIHEEIAEVPTSIFETIVSLKQSKKKIVAVGTTACRTLESLGALWKNMTEEQKWNFS
jgi:S-adenosylmethionine:tRNA ribosyltransferase-isomerase